MNATIGLIGGALVGGLFATTYILIRIHITLLNLYDVLVLIYRRKEK